MKNLFWLMLALLLYGGMAFGQAIPRQAGGSGTTDITTDAEGFIRKTGAGTYAAIKSNLSATANPTVDDDSGDGYGIGSVWVNLTLDTVWQAVDVTPGSAVWKQLDSSTTITLEGAKDNGNIIDNAVSVATAARIGGANIQLIVYEDTGALVATCYNVSTTTVSDCDHGIDLKTGKEFYIKNNAGTKIFRFAQTACASLAQGQILYYTGSTWECLAVGTSGQLLKTNGAGANPAWATQRKVVQVAPFGPTTDVATGDGKAYFRVPTTLNGMNLVAVSASVITAGTTNATNVDLARCAAASTGNVCSGTVADMLSTNITIDSGENDTATAATAAVINTSNDDVATGQIIRIDVDAISTTAPKGLIVNMEFELP